MKRNFTMAELAWQPWLEPCLLDDCTEDMTAALVENGPNAKTNPYYLTLVHDAPALRARSRLFNAVMYGTVGLPRADRELVATAESRANGCVFCASVHSRMFVNLANDQGETMQQLLEHGPAIETTPRNQALLNYAVRLGSHPIQADQTDIDALRAAGLTDEEIADAAYSIAMFAWANRLMLTLGEPMEIQK